MANGRWLAAATAQVRWSRPNAQPMRLESCMQRLDGHACSACMLLRGTECDGAEAEPAWHGAPERGDSVALTFRS